ncbi:fimbria/pilus periplasmic chaperone [Sphingopyxis sp. R3-92]|uniref:fimbria/pilus periplasmic chaperone n=1 Tax=Sphingopyxis sp. R3-92 TaxID=3158553 RepID=UPI003EE703A0
MFRNLLTALAVLFFVALPVQAEAARVSPMVVNVTPSGRGSIARIELANPADREFPVEVMMMRGDISEEGELTMTPADQDFLVFPAQIVVKPRSQQVLRVQYVGDADLAKSQIYYAAVRQLPVEFEPGESQVQVVVNFNVLVNVVPENTRAEPIVEIIGPVTREGKPGIDVRVTNRGTRFFLAGNIAWDIAGRTVEGVAVKVRRTPEEMAKAVGVGVVAPDKSRRFFIPFDQVLEPATISAAPVL